MKWIRQNPEKVRQAMEHKGVTGVDLDRLIELDQQRREMLQQVEALKAERNIVSEEIGRLKREKRDAEEKVLLMRKVADQIKQMDEKLRTIEEDIQQILLTIPNPPDEDVPVGPDESANRVVRSWGEPTRFDFEPKPHWELGVGNGWLDFERAGKITGSRFAVLWREGARLMRALTDFMLDLHTMEHGYTEVAPPYMVNSRSMIGTGQLPKFGEDAFRVQDYDYWLIPTAEVPVTNLFRDDILDGELLPIRLVAYTPCFRSEAGAAGRDTRGLIRQHQFDKVELVQFVLPEESERALEELLSHAENVLQKLELPYRVVEMCTGDLGFAAAKKYDLEVWMPSYGRYVEISSCSNFRDFQARRANIRFRRQAHGKVELPHTLNGSALAVGRCLAALIENGQQSDGSILLPETLRPYFPEQILRAQMH